MKGDSAHPGTSKIVAEAIRIAADTHGIHPGVFSLILGGNREVGTALVRHPFIKAVGFIGSLCGARALPRALDMRGRQDRRRAASLTTGAGQFWTNPVIAVVVGSSVAELFTAAAVRALEPIGSQTMLTGPIAAAYREGRRRLSPRRVSSACPTRMASPATRPSLFSDNGLEISASTLATRCRHVGWTRNWLAGAEQTGP